MSITPGTGLVVNVSYDSSVGNAPSGFTTAVAAAVTYIERTFTNPITVNIAVGYNEVDGQTIGAAALGESLNNSVYISYGQLLAALPGDGLPATNPTGNGVFQVSDAEAKALGLSGNGAIVDGYIGLSNAYAFTYDPNNRSVYGEYDAIATIEHEITEVMGRVSGLGQSTYRGQPVYAPLDLFRYASAGSRALSPSTAYFSTNGTALQAQFNDPRNGDDGGDWASSVAGDAFGDGALGVAGQVSATDLAVMQALGYGVAAASVAATVPSSAGPAATVTGVNGAVVSIAFGSATLAAMAQTLLTPFSSAEAAGGIVPAFAGAAASVPAGKYGLLEVTAGGQYAIGIGYEALVDNAAAQTTVFGGNMAGQVVVAGTAGLAFNAGTGSGTVIVGGGNNLISVLQGAGAQNIMTGAGDDTISVLTGANTISAGAGNNLILAQGGNDLINSVGTDLINLPTGNTTVNAGTNNPTVFLGAGAAQFNGGNGQATVVVGGAAATLNSAGHDQLWMQAGGGVVHSSLADTIIGGSGAATVNAGAGSDFVFAGSGKMDLIAGSGASTILGAAGGSSTVVGGAGSVIAIAYGATNFIGGSGAATVAGFGGSVTITGGRGTGVFMAGPGGNSRISAAAGGHATMIGGADGDVLTGNALGGDVFEAGAGAETLNAAGAVGSNKFYGGSGADLITLGSAGDQVLAGSGTETLIGGAGSDLFAFANGSHPSVTIENFSAVLNQTQVPRDYVSFIGFSAGEATQALSSATVVAGSEQLTLSDGTKILFLGVTGLTNSSFL